MASVSVNQLSALVDFLESNRELALGYCNTSKEGRSQARRLWEQCSTVLNSVSGNCVQKTPDQWRLYYNENKNYLTDNDTMHEASARLEAMERLRAEATCPSHSPTGSCIGSNSGEAKRANCNCATKPPTGLEVTDEDYSSESE